MAHPLLSRTLPAAAALAVALTLAASVPPTPPDATPIAFTPDRSEAPAAADAVSLAAGDAATSCPITLDRVAVLGSGFEALFCAGPEFAAGPSAPEAEPPVALLAEWAPRPLSAPDEARFGTGEAFWLSEQGAGRLARMVPLPVRRPADLQRLAVAQALRRAERLAARRTTTAAAPTQTEDTRSFFEKLLGVEKPAAPAPALAYAALENGAAESASRQRLAAPVLTPSSGGIAVYDISAQSVVLPNGERLEAHSGLGESMDDPRFVHLKMRGATPPGVYDLTEREAAFHGVRALRLTPVGGSEAVHNRVGLLAHTYLLGPAGASNGCVSFKDYDRFLQAYLRGEVGRLVVVAGSGRPTGPVVAQR